RSGSCPARAWLCSVTPTPAADESPASSSLSGGPLPCSPCRSPPASGNRGVTRRVCQPCSRSSGPRISLSKRSAITDTLTCGRTCPSLRYAAMSHAVLLVIGLSVRPAGRLVAGYKGGGPVSRLPADPGPQREISNLLILTSLI